MAAPPRTRTSHAAALAPARRLAAFWGRQARPVGRSVETYAQYWSRPRGRSGVLLYAALGYSAVQAHRRQPPPTGATSGSWPGG